MPDTLQKPILAFLNHIDHDTDQTRTVSALLRSCNLWIDDFSYPQPIPVNYQSAAEIELDDVFSLAVLRWRPPPDLDPRRDPALMQWMIHAKDVLDGLSGLFPEPRFFYSGGISMDLADGYGARPVTPPDIDDTAKTNWVETTLAHLDILRSIDVLSDMLTEDLLHDLAQGASVHRGNHRIEDVASRAGQTAVRYLEWAKVVAAKALLREEFPAICDRLRVRFGEERFRLWLGALHFEDFDGACLRVSAPNTFLRNAISTHLAHDILLSCRKTYAKVQRVEVVLRRRSRSRANRAVTDSSRPAQKKKISTGRLGRLMRTKRNAHRHSRTRDDDSDGR